MKTIYALLCLYCCVIFFSMPTKGQPLKNQTFPFCPIDKKTEQKILKVKTMLKRLPQWEILKKQKYVYIDLAKNISRTRRSTVTPPCGFLLPNCIAISLRTTPAAELSIHGDMQDCCFDCQAKFTGCVPTKSCLDCIVSWTQCFTNCTSKYCPEREDPCPTTTRKHDGSTCTERSCYPVYK